MADILNTVGNVVSAPFKLLGSIFGASDQIQSVNKHLGLNNLMSPEEKEAYLNHEIREYNAQKGGEYNVEGGEYNVKGGSYVVGGKRYAKGTHGGNYDVGGDYNVGGDYVVGGAKQRKMTMKDLI